MNLIALAGFKGSGKDTVGSHLVQKFGFHSLSYADALKDTVAAVFCWDRKLLTGDSRESREWRETVDEWWSEKLGIPGFTPRIALQQVGTELFRTHFNPDIWIMNVEKRIRDLGNQNIVIMDGRFPNELGLARKFGGKVVRIKRGPEPEWFETAITANDTTLRAEPRVNARTELLKVYKVHESEWAWIGQKFDAVIENDGSFDKLFQTVEQKLFPDHVPEEINI